MIPTIDRIVGGSGPETAIRPNPVSSPTTSAPTSTGATGGASSFADTLAAAGREHSVTLSGHAMRRMEQRQIDLGASSFERLGKAMDSLAARGGRQSLVMLDQVAYVVHVPSHTVITAVAPGDQKEAVFTKIDSVVIA